MIVFPVLIPGQNFLFPGTRREISNAKWEGKGNLRLVFPGITGNGNSRSPLPQTSLKKRMNFRKSSKGGGGGRVIFNPKIYIADFCIQMINIIHIALMLMMMMIPLYWWFWSNFVPFQLWEILLRMQDLLLLSESFLILETSFSLLNGKTDWLRKLHPKLNWREEERYIFVLLY